MVRRAWLPCAIVGFVAVMTVGPGTGLFASPPHPPPDDPCALVAADLLARLVPGARVDERVVRTGRYTTFAVCAFRSGEGAPAVGLLWLRVERHGDRGGQDPGQHAQDGFARGKRAELAGGVPVSDLRGLGDSAYVAGPSPAGGTVSSSGGGPGSSPVEVTVRVLRGDLTLAVRYQAAPSEPVLVAGGAVAAARAALERVP
ncbi:hypothetical protein Val02_60400 [Virgisporangium aliadipatigenens]|uniref:Uncharacterized protein n=1 Tax=Virgisporangium aliadipatigenens TaxID=741659 RepID=A0A8J3YP66_9ACTN|nr:hypothetical protein Val02_60400 [Virgisporangium aliadipatigenens]